MRPPESKQLDYEGEVPLVTGKRGRRIPQARWAEQVSGDTIANEGSVRDWSRHGKVNVTPAKSRACSGAPGPCIVAADAIGSGPKRVTIRVNGDVRHDDTTVRMMVPFGRIIGDTSAFCTLEPAGLILTGTPSAAEARFGPPRVLAPGHRVKIELPAIGVLRNTVAGE